MAAQLPWGEIAREITRAGLPALFLDTCSALDVVRCAARSQPSIAAIARQLIEAQVAGELLLFGPSVLTEEAARNRVDVEGKARKSAREVDDAMAAHRRVSDIIGASYPHTTPFSHEDLIAPLMKLHDQLLAACVHTTTDPAIETVALKRAGKRRRPARGGGGANDCLMFEEFRSIAQAIPAADPLVLLTTNKDDFAIDKGSSVIHPEIADDLIGTKARVCLNWNVAAVAVLTEARLKFI